MIIFIPGTSAARSLWVEWLPIGPLITSVAAATPGSFSSPLSPPLHLESLPPFYFTPSSVCPSPSSLLKPPFNGVLRLQSLWPSLSLCYTFIISSSLPHLPLLDHFTFTPPPLLISTCRLFFRSFSFVSTPWSMETGSYLQSCLQRCADVVLYGNRNVDKRNFLACSFVNICNHGHASQSKLGVLRRQPIYWHLSKWCATFIFLY